MHWDAPSAAEIQKRISQLFSLFVGGVAFASICLSGLLRPLLLTGSSEVQIVINYVYKRLYRFPNSLYLYVHKGVFLYGVNFCEAVLLQLKEGGLSSQLFVVVIWVGKDGNMLSITFILLDDLLWHIRLHPNHPNARIDSDGVFLNGGCAGMRKLSRSTLDKLWSGRLVYCAEKHTFLSKQCRKAPFGVKL